MKPDEKHWIIMKAEDKALKMGQRIEPTFNVRTDILRVQQVLINLLTNGLKYTSESGWVKIRCLVYQNDKNDKKYLSISVQDNGLGIKENDQKKLFKLFSRVSSKNDKRLNKRGIGLGLMICKKIVE